MMSNGGYLISCAACLFIGLLAGIGIEHQRGEKKREKDNFDAAKKYVDLCDERDKVAWENEMLRLKCHDIEIFQNQPKDEGGEDDPGPGENEDEGEPEVISEAEYQFRIPGEQTLVLEYYREDGVLTEDIGEDSLVVSDPEGMLGEEAMWVLQNTDDDVIYVDNPKLGMAYEISIKDEAYTDISEYDEEDV